MKYLVFVGILFCFALGVTLDKSFYLSCNVPKLQKKSQHYLCYLMLAVGALLMQRLVAFSKVLPVTLMQWASVTQR